MGEAFNLAILLTLKDAASGGLDRFEAKLRSAGKEGEHFAKELDKIRSNLSRDLAIGGVGIAGLQMLKDGVQVAADYQSVMTDLRATIAQTGKDGSIDRGKLAEDMLASEAVAVRLGNKLPGTTADFAQMMQVLKQNGLETTTIVNGAADAVGNLAVASNAVPKDIAADFARFGNLFKLRAEDFAPAADVFSRIYTSTGQTSAELVEAAKYFQGRAGTSLGIGGLKDAEQMTRLFGLMGKQGMSGSMAGMGLTQFFNQYTTHRDKLKDLQKATGIKLDFFDKKGKFVGLDSVIEQMSQFDKLSAKDRTAWMDEIFGVLGAGAGNILVNANAWKQFNAEQDKTISLTDKTAMKAADFNNQMEALKGTLTNLTVAVFEPMLPGMTSAIEKGNQLVTLIQLFTKSHPDIAKYAVSTLAIGSAAMVAYSGIKMLTAGVRLFRLASAFSRSEGLLGSMTATSAATTTATKNVAGFTSQVVGANEKTSGLKKNLFSLNNVFKAVLVLEAIGFTWDQISNLRKTIDEWKSMQGGLDDTARQSFTAYQGLPSDQRDPKAESQQVLRLLQAGNNEFTKALDPSKQTWTDWMALGYSPQLFKGKPGTSEILRDPQLYGRAQQLQQMPFKQSLVDGLFANAFERVGAEVAAVKNLRERAPSLGDPSVMSSFRKDVMPTMGLSPEKSGFLDQILKQAFPESFSASLTGIATSAESFAQSLTSLQQPLAGTAELFSGLPLPVGDTATAFSNLGQPMDETNKSFGDITNSARPLPGAFNNIFISANSVADSLSIVSSNLANWRPPVTPSTAFNPDGTPSIINPPGFAVGGHIKRSGLAFVHAGEKVVPAQASRFNDELLRDVYESGRPSGGGSPIVLNYSPTINVKGGDAQAAGNFRKELDKHARHIERLVAKQMANGRVRA